MAIKLVSRTPRHRATARIYALRATYFIPLATKKLDRTIPPLGVTPMENNWAPYGPNLHSGHLDFGKYRPGSPWAASSSIRAAVVSYPQRSP